MGNIQRNFMIALAFAGLAACKRETGASHQGGFDGQFSMNSRSCSSGGSVQDAVTSFGAEQSYVFNGNTFQLTTTFQTQNGRCTVIEEGFYTAAAGKLSVQNAKQSLSAECTDDGQPRSESNEDQLEMTYELFNEGKTISISDKDAGNGCPEGDSIVTILERE